MVCVVCPVHWLTSCEKHRANRRSSNDQQRGKRNGEERRVRWRSVWENRDICVCVFVCEISASVQTLRLANGRLALCFSLLLMINSDGWWMAGCRRHSESILWYMRVLWDLVWFLLSCRLADGSVVWFEINSYWAQISCGLWWCCNFRRWSFTIVTAFA